MLNNNAKEFGSSLGSKEDIDEYFINTIRMLADALGSVERSRGFPEKSHTNTSFVYGVYMTGHQIVLIRQALEKANALQGDG